MRPGYWADYRRRHPSYREREAERMVLRNRAVVVDVTLTDVLLSLVVDEVERTSVHALSAELAFEPETVRGWLCGRCLPDSASIDTMMYVFTWKRVIDRRADLRAAYHMDPGIGTADLLGPAGSRAPGPFLPKELPRGGRHPWRAWTAA